MIRKPDARDFRESGTVSALRDAGTLAVEGARGVGEGTRKFVARGVGLIFVFGFVMSMLAAMGPVGGLILVGGVVTWVLLRLGKRRRRLAEDRTARWGEPSASWVRPTEPATGIEPVRLEMSVKSAGRSIAMFAVPAILFMPTSGLFSFMLPFLLGAIVAMALALLIVARLTGDRTIATYDGVTLTVNGLLGETSILWADVGNVVVRKASFFDLKVLFTSGARNNLVILGRFNRLGGADTLYVPLDLLDLDRAATAALVTRFLDLRAGPGTAGERPPPPVVVPEPTPRPDVAALPFDADEIMRRYLAERADLVAAQRPDLAATGGRRTFGRKTA